MFDCILVPLKIAKENHQLQNALCFQKENSKKQFIKVIEEENKPIPILQDKSHIFNKKDEILPEKLEDSDDEDTNIKFNDVDMIRDIHNNDNQVLAPKTFERLDEISNIRNEQRKLEDSDDSDDDENELVKLKISDNISNNHLGFELLEPEILDESENLLSGFIEELH